MKNKNFILNIIPLILLMLFSFGNFSQNVLAQIPNCSEYANDGYDCYSYDKCDPNTQIDALCSNQDHACCKPQGAGKTNNTSFSIENPLGETSDIYTLVMKILDFLIVLAIPLTAILVIYAGLVYITSAGNEEKIKTAQKTLIWALIGFAVVLLAKGIPQLIIDFLQGNNSTSTTTTTSPSTEDLFTGVDFSTMSLGGRYIYNPSAASLEDMCKPGGTSCPKECDLCAGSSFAD